MKPWHFREHATLSQGRFYLDLPKVGKASPKPLCYMPLCVLNRFSYLRCTARFGQPHEIMLFEEFHACGIENVAGEENHAPVHGGRFGLQQMVKILPIEFWQAQIAEDEVILLRVNLLQCRFAIVCRLHCMPIAAQECCQRFGKPDLIINHQNRQARLCRHVYNIFSQKTQVVPSHGTMLRRSARLCCC